MAWGFGVLGFPVVKEKERVFLLCSMVCSRGANPRLCEGLKVPQPPSSPPPPPDKVLIRTQASKDFTSAFKEGGLGHRV